MSWTDALRPWNGSTAKKVALYMQSEWGWDVTIIQGRLEFINASLRYGKQWQYSEELKHDLEEQVQRLINALDMSLGQFEALDRAAKEDGAVGKYTILPFPKDIIPQRAAPASHFQ
jgi:hypothetical protein